MVTWGSSSNGGDSSGVAAQLTDVVSIANTSEAFTALKADGTVVSWGNSARGGSITNFVGSGLNNILYVVGSLSGFSAQRKDGEVVYWGANINAPLDIGSITQTDTINLLIHQSLKAFQIQIHLSNYLR